MRHTLFIFFFCLVCKFCQGQSIVNPYIPHGAIFYNSQWKKVPSASQASFYRLLAIDDSGNKMFYDYYITGELYAEKHYSKLGAEDDKHTVLEGLSRRFHKFGRVESVMFYKNGKADGRAISFYPDGQIGMKLVYAQGLLDGVCYTYSRNGRLEYTTEWHNGKKIRETLGGKDLYIDKRTNEDPFCQRYRSDEHLIMAQAKSITARQKSIMTNPSKVDGKKQVVKTSNNKVFNSCQSIKDSQQQTPIATMPLEQSLNTSKKEKSQTQNIVPDQNKTISHAGTINPILSDHTFSYVHSILENEDERIQSIQNLTDIAQALHLTSKQVVEGSNGYQEILFHENMTYDTMVGKDKILGNNPRQIAFGGLVDNKKMNVQRITLYTWSEQEMLGFAREAILQGFKQLTSGQDYLLSDGNFIFESPSSMQNIHGSSILITFTHVPQFYEGLYHIQMIRK